MTTINAELSVLYQTSGFVELHTLDCSEFGGEVYHYTPNIYSDGAAIVYGGITYAFMPIESIGWAQTSQGALPQPQVRISNVTHALLAAVVQLGDIVGAKYTRIRTFEKFLDRATTHDATQYLGPDRYIIYQKLSHNNTEISFQLSSPFDIPGLELPARTVLKDTIDEYGGFPGVNLYQ